jgi:hypothetical protein
VRALALPPPAATNWRALARVRAAANASLRASHRDPRCARPARQRVVRGRRHGADV